MNSYQNKYQTVRNIFAGWVVLFFTGGIGAQILSGKITDERGDAVPYANIFVPKYRSGTLSDAHGLFSLNISPYQAQDSLYVSHLSFNLEKIPLQTLKNQQNINIVLHPADIHLTLITLTAQKPKLKTLKPFGVRFAGAVANFSPLKYAEDTEKDYNSSEEMGDFIQLKKPYIAKEFRMRWINNRFEKIVLRLFFYKVEDQSLTPLMPTPLLIHIPKIEQKTEISEPINVSLPRGKIWVGISLVDFIGTKEDTFSLPITFTGGWLRHGLSDFEKIPLGLGFSFSVKGIESVEKK